MNKFAYLFALTLLALGVYAQTKTVPESLLNGNGAATSAAPKAVPTAASKALPASGDSQTTAASGPASSKLPPNEFFSTTFPVTVQTTKTVPPEFLTTTAGVAATPVSTEENVIEDSSALTNKATLVALASVLIAFMAYF